MNGTMEREAANGMRGAGDNLAVRNTPMTDLCGEIGVAVKLADEVVSLAFGASARLVGPRPELAKEAVTPPLPCGGQIGESIDRVRQLQSMLSAAAIELRRI